MIISRIFIPLISLILGGLLRNVQSLDVIVSNPNLLAENLFKALAGTEKLRPKFHEDLSKIPCAQRMEIAKIFHQKYGKHLDKYISEHTKGSYQTLLLSMFKCDPASLYAFLLRASFVGLGTDEKNLIETIIILSKRPEYRDSVVKTYGQMFASSLYADMQGETSGDLLNVLTELAIRSRRVTGAADNVLAIEIVNLLKTEMHNWESTRTVLDATLMESSIDQLPVIFAEFSKIVGSDIELITKNKFSGEKQIIYTGLIRYMKNELEFAVDSLFECLNGFGNDISTIRNILAAAQDGQIPSLKIRFQEKYRVTLSTQIQKGTAGDHFTDLLLTIVDGKSPKTPKKQNDSSSSSSEETV